MIPALSYHLKKLLHFNAPKPKTKYQAIEIQLKKALKSAAISIFGSTIHHALLQD